jgi:hypothetical protein
MNPNRSLQIIQINVNDAGKQMPPDVKTALLMGISAISRVLSMRSYNISQAKLPLAGETSIPDLAPSADRKQRLRESPLGKEPK